MDNHEQTRDARVRLGDTDSLRTTAAGQLRHLDDLHDFTIAEGEPDIRGWDVRGTDGTKLGKVEDLLVDTAALKVRYIEVKLEKEIASLVARDGGIGAVADTSPTRHTDLSTQDLTGSRARADDIEQGTRFVLVPIGVARLDDDHDDVLLDAQAAQMAGIPAYNRASLTRDYESDVVRGYEGIGDNRPKNDVMRQAVPTESQGRSADDTFYADRTFDDRSFFGGRRDSGIDRSYVVRGDERPHAGIDDELEADGRTARRAAARDRTVMDSPTDLDGAIRDQSREIRDR